MAYVTADDLRAEGVPESYTDEWIEGRIALAEAYVETQTGQWFEPRDLTMVFDGSGDTTLLLPICLLEVTSITLDDVELTDDELADVVNYNRRGLAQDDRRNPKLVRLGGYTWTEGVQNVSIEGSWGYVEADDSTPLAILEVVKRLVIRDIDPLADTAAQRERREAIFGTSFSAHNRSVTLSQAAVTGGPTNDPQIDRALTRFRRPLTTVTIGVPR